jgi:hypothetical protein
MRMQCTQCTCIARALHAYHCSEAPNGPVWQLSVICGCLLLADLTSLCTMCRTPVEFQALRPAGRQQRRRIVELGTAVESVMRERYSVHVQPDGYALQSCTRCAWM